jgi:hypothetical protein
VTIGGVICDGVVFVEEVLFVGEVMEGVVVCVVVVVGGVAVQVTGAEVCAPVIIAEGIIVPVETILVVVSVSASGVESGDMPLLTL